MRFIFETTKDLEDFTTRLVNAVAHERYWTKRWMAHFGHTNRTEMTSWQERSDSLINELQITDKDLNRRFAVEIKTPEILTSGEIEK